jgi:hypothetical protein
MAQRARRLRRRRRTALLAVAGVVLLLAAGSAFYFLFAEGQHATETKPIILYVNQGNGVVNESSFGALTGFATSHGFNTLFFQVYREGVLLFTPSQLDYFVNDSHSGGLSIFFALYITNSAQTIPASIYTVGEDGINLDMSTIPLSAQQSLLSNLQAAYHGQTAVTTTDLASPLRPDLLILETYGTGLNQYIKPGIIASVGVFTTTSEQDYQSQFQYALQNSDGVMVFDYAGLMKRGY